MRTFEEIFKDLNDDVKRVGALVELNDLHVAESATLTSLQAEVEDTKKKLSDMTATASSLVMRVTGNVEDTKPEKTDYDIFTDGLKEREV